LKKLKFTLLAFASGFIGSLFAVSLIAGRDNNWQSWPTQFMIGFMRTSTAESAKEYLEIATGVPESYDSGMAIGATETAMYVSVGDNKWIELSPDAVFGTILLENNGLAKLETGALIFSEQ